MDELPAGWQWQRLTDLVANEPNAMTDGPFGSNLKTADYVPNGEVRVIRLGNIGIGKFIDDDRSFVSREKFEGLRKHEAQAGDLVIAALAEPVGRAMIVPDFVGPAMVKADCVRVRIKPIHDTKYVMHSLNSPQGLQRAEAMGHGTGRLRINLGEMRELLVPVAPPAEQRRVVSRIETLQSSSRRAREALDAIPPLLERFRQSVLAAAFRGDLTAEWRAKNPDIEPADALVRRTPEPGGKSTGRAAANVVRYGQCGLAVGDPGTAAPPGWKWVALSRIARMESGHTPSREHAHYWNGSIPWIGIRDAREHHGKEIVTTSQTVTPEGIANSAARLLPARTVCLSRTASVGYVTIMGQEMATSQDFANWICSGALEPEYLMFALLAEGDHLRTFGEGSTHTTIYFPELKALHICLAPIEEQREIIRLVRSRLAVIERLQARASELLAALPQLDSAILAKAFRGELVPQDPTDEPASALLARVAAAPNTPSRTPDSCSSTTPARRPRRSARAKA